MQASIYLGVVSRILAKRDLVWGLGFRVLGPSLWSTLLALLTLQGHCGVPHQHADGPRAQFYVCSAGLECTGIKGIIVFPKYRDTVEGLNYYLYYFGGSLS